MITIKNERIHITFLFSCIETVEVRKLEDNKWYVIVIAQSGTAHTLLRDNEKAALDLHTLLTEGIAELKNND